MVRTASSATRRIGPILLVDDYDDARALTREALENAGYAVIEAAHGQHALDLLVSRTDERVALIVLDLQMPVMDGWRLLELMSCYVGLRKIPVIIASGQEARLEQLRHPRIFGCLKAPYTLEQLVETVDACMTGVRSPAARSTGTGNDAG